MALSRQKKESIVEETVQLLNTSKMVVIAQYTGTGVKPLQQLRRDAKDNGTQIRIMKNRLFKLALSQVESMKDTEITSLNGQLMYVFNSQDEVAPAQLLAKFAKKEPQVKFINGVSHDGQLLSVDDLKMLADLPSKDQLRAQLVGTLAAPMSGFVNVLAGNIRGVLNVLSARADQLPS